MHNIVICGGGNGAHVLSSLAKSSGNTNVSILTIPEEVEKLNSALNESGGIRVCGNDGDGGAIDIKFRPDNIVSDPSLVIPGADMVVLVLPAFVHEILLGQIAGYLKPGTTIVGMPGQAGFEFVLKQKLGEDLYRKVSIITLASLPWACRINEFGKDVTVIGTKVKLGGSAVIADNTKEDISPVELLQKILGKRPILDTSSHLATYTVYNLNAVVHPNILYGQWKDWNGTPLSESPLFYQGMSEETAERMEAMVEEIKSIAKEFNISNLPTLLEVYKELYSNQLKDDSTLHKAITGNSAYVGLTHPVKKLDDGKLVPQFDHRYLTEDLPNGLVVIKGIADIVGTKTPIIDTILRWSQEKINKEYICTNNKLEGKHVKETRAPQKYGIKTKEDLLKCY